MAVLLLACVGPMQSWGTRSRFDDRDTEMEPSKSGVIGMMCAAIGRDRSKPVEDFAAMKMGVRVDREGVLQKDFQTALNPATADGKTRREAVVSTRWYLADAAFLVGLEGDAKLLMSVHHALKRPHWPLSLGRKSYLPSFGPYLPGGYFETGNLREALRTYPTLVKPAGQNGSRRRVVLESDERTENVRKDVPISFGTKNRRFDERYVRMEWWDVKGEIFLADLPGEAR